MQIRPPDRILLCNPADFHGHYARRLKRKFPAHVFGVMRLADGLMPSPRSIAGRPVSP
jgi:hypothetical protein